MEILENATSCRLSWCKGMSVYAPRGGHVQTFTSVSRIHTRGQIRVKAMGRHELNCQSLGTHEKNTGLQHGKIFRWHRKAGARRAQWEKIEKVRKCNQAQRKESNKNSAVLHTMWKQKAMVPREGKAHCLIVHWQNDVKASLYYKAWQISLICQMLVGGLRA